MADGSMMLQAVGAALMTVLSPSHLWLLGVGVLMGLLLGASVGLSGLNGIAILLPLIVSANLQPSVALVIMTGIIGAQHCGDVITAILLGIPGTAAAQATIMDGHALARQGRAKEALSAAMIASGVGGVFGAICLSIVIPIARPLVLALGTPELLMLTILGISSVALLSGRNLLRGVLLASVGLLLALVGYTPDKAVPRFTFGTEYLENGIPLVAMTLGIFGLPEVFSVQIRGDRISSAAQLGGGFVQGLRAYFRHWALSLRCSAIGVVIALIPGLGGAVIDWIAYAHAVQTARNRELFGKGDIRGVIGPEAANQSKEGGAFIPTILFGIPGSGSMALFLAGLFILGISPGKAMIETVSGLTLTFTIVWSLAIGNVISTVFVLLCVRPLAKVTTLNFSYVAPVVIALVVVAAFQATGDWGDVFVLLAFGILGWFMKQWRWPRPPLLIGFILGNLAERYFFISDVRYGADWLLRPGVLVIAAITLAGIVWGLRITRSR